MERVGGRSQCVREQEVSGAACRSCSCMPGEGSAGHDACSPPVAAGPARGERQKEGGERERVGRKGKE